MSPSSSGARAPPGPVVAEFDRPRVPHEPISVAVVADPHLSVGKRGTWKVFHRTEARLRTALRIADGGTAAPAADAVVVAGDLTRDGERAEFDRADDLLGDLTVPWTVLPGNHDVPKAFDDHDGLPLSAFHRRYAGDAVPPEVDALRDAGGYPTVLRVGALRVVCLNTAAPPGADFRDTWGGAVGDRGRERLRGLLAAAPEAPTLVVAHHNLGALPEHEPRRPWSRFPAADADAVRRLLRTAGVSLAVTAHHHVPAVREHGGLVELLAPPACSFPQAILWLRVGPDGTTVRSVPLSGPEGVTEAYWHAATGSPLGQGILDLVRSRLPTPATRADRSG